MFSETFDIKEKVEKDYLTKNYYLFILTQYLRFEYFLYTA